MCINIHFSSHGPCLIFLSTMFPITFILFLEKELIHSFVKCIFFLVEAMHVGFVFPRSRVSCLLQQVNCEKSIIWLINIVQVTVALLTENQFIPLLMRPKGCQDMRQDPLNVNLMVWCAKIDLKLKKTSKNC